jgi:hypothetical protein
MEFLKPGPDLAKKRHRPWIFKSGRRTIFNSDARVVGGRRCELEFVLR